MLEMLQSLMVSESVCPPRDPPAASRSLRPARLEIFWSLTVPFDLSVDF